MSVAHEVIEGLQFQLSGEQIVWKLDVANKTASPSNPLVPEVIDETTGDDVKDTVMPAESPQVNGTEITLPTLQGLTAQRTYRVLVRWTDQGNLRESYFRVYCPL